MIKEEELEKIVSKYKKLEDQLNASIKDRDDFILISKEYSELKPIIEQINIFNKLNKEIEDLSQIIENEGHELVDIAKKELIEVKNKFEDSEKNLKYLLIPKDPLDQKDVILEIRAGTGGDEAALFAGDLLRMYQRFSEAQNWKFELLSISDSEKGGFKEVISKISGQSVYSKMKFESGVHRVQRVPETESQGRVHTSAASVVVLPEADDVDVNIEEKDLRIDVFRASGAGGQHVNTTDSAVRITHLPTGIAVQQQDEKSQHKNKAKGMKILRARLYELERTRIDQERSADRKSKIGTGDRSERIRTYNFPQGRVTDHRINLTLHKLEEFLEGEAFDEIIESLSLKAQEESLSKL